MDQLTLDHFIQIYDIEHLLPSNFVEQIKAALHQHARKRERTESDARYSNHIYHFNHDMEPSIRKCLWSITEHITKMYSKAFRITYGAHDEKEYNPLANMFNDEGFYFYMYGDDEFCEIHVDQNPQHPRDISVIVMLNDDYCGGEIEFYCGKHMIKSIAPSKNKVVVFPSNFLYAHRVTSVRNGVRCVLVYWIRVG